MEHAAKLVWLSDTTSASSAETSLYQTGVTKGKVIPEDVNFLSDFIEVWTKSLTFSLKVMFLSCRSRSEADTPLCPRLQLLILPYLSPILPNLFVTFLGLKHVSCVHGSWKIFNHISISRNYLLWKDANMSDSVDLDCRPLKLTFLGDHEDGLAADILNIASSEVKPREQGRRGAARLRVKWWTKVSHSYEPLFILFSSLKSEKSNLRWYIILTFMI